MTAEEINEGIRRNDEAVQSNNAVHAMYVAQRRTRDAITTEFNLDAQRIADSLILESARLGVDPHEAFEQLQINLPAAVQEQLDAVQKLMWPHIHQHC